MIWETKVPFNATGGVERIAYYSDGDKAAQSGHQGNYPRQAEQDAHLGEASYWTRIVVLDDRISRGGGSNSSRTCHNHISKQRLLKTVQLYKSLITSNAEMEIESRARKYFYEKQHKYAFVPTNFSFTYFVESWRAKVSAFQMHLEKKFLSFFKEGTGGKPNTSSNMIVWNAYKKA